jgi:3-phosphoshikimate 1-carboxyvinyltransferase
MEDKHRSSIEQASLTDEPAAGVLHVEPGGALNGEVGGDGASPLPGDKSLSHRAALFAAMAEGESCIQNFLVSGVTRAMLDALTILNVPWMLNGRSLQVHGIGLKRHSYARRNGEPLVFDCGNSATTFRLLAGALAAWNIPAILDGSPGLRRRPMQRLAAPLQQMGVDIQTTDGHAPLFIRPSSHPLKALDYELPVASAQVKSCLLLAGLAVEGVTILVEPGPSRDHTERMLGAMGVEINSFTHPGADGRPLRWVTRLIPPASARLAPLQMTLPNDMSAAAFLIVAALITPGSQIHLRGVGLNPTRTGLLDTLLEMGADIQIHQVADRGGEPTGDLIIRHSALHGVEVSGERVVRMIDEFPVFAVAAAYAHGETRVRDAEELRHKESDRISALGGELRSLGVDFSETPDGFIVQGGQPLRGRRVQSHGDHRLAMSLAVAGLAAQAPVQVAGAEMIHESFPDFVSVMRSLGASIHFSAT